jgi:pyruvate carboxylase subunit B
MTTIRNFDALNDVNNLKWSGQCIHDAGLKHEVVVSMMGLPPGVDNKGAHTPEFYAERLKQILKAEIPFDRVCFKDASGTAAPRTVYETIKLARKLLPAGTHIQFHSHETAANGLTCYLAALEGGADGIDLSMAPVSGGTCQPDIITMWHALRGSEFDLDIDIEKIRGAEEAFKEAMKDYFLPPEALSASPVIIWSPMPGGALTANTQMLRDNGLMDKYDQMIDEMYDAVRCGGFGTSVTPVSQFYFQQAFNNVMFGKWKKIAPGYGKMVLGYFGKTPAAPDPEVVKIAAEQLGLEPTKKTVLEINDADPKKGRAAAEQMLKDAGLAITDENVFIAASCLEKGIAYLKDPANAPLGIRLNEKPKAVSAGGACTVTVNGKAYGVELKDGKAIVNGTAYDYSVADGIAAAPAATAGAATGEAITAPLPGLVLRITAPAGTAVKKDDEILVIEAMKMEMPIKAPKDGVIASIAVNNGDKINAGDTLATM